MYAVIKAGGKQHRVKSGDVIEVELVHGQPGDAVEFQPLLVVDDDGKTHHGKDLAKAVVVGKLVGEQKGDKIKVFKYRAKTGYSRRQGHRQLMTLLEIEDVRLDPKKTGSRKAEEAPAVTDASEATEAPEATEAAAKPAPKRQTARATATKTEDEEETPEAAAEE
jgi:large subunit ribosomal protein L21